MGMLALKLHPLKVPAIFSTNYFLKDGGEYCNGKLDKSIWVKWMELRIHGDADAIDAGYGLIPKYAELVYNGFWFAPEREAIQALVTESQKDVSGEVRMKLYKGNVIAAGVRSPFSLYSEDVATMEGGAEEAYNQDDATGFIRLNGLRLKTSARVRR